MKLTIVLLTLGLALACVRAAEPSQAALEAQAKISQAQAEKIALAKVPHGQIKSAEIENEKGHLVWSFDIAVSKSKNITEVLVDAKTGKVLSVDTETPEQQAQEAKADAKK